MENSMKSSIAFVLTIIMSIQIFSVENAGLNITHFINNDNEKELGLYWPDNSSWGNFSIPANSFILNATMNISGLPSKYDLSTYPIAPSLSLDNTTLWTFNGSGYGALGRQDSFSVGTDAILNFSHGGEISNITIQIPKNAHVKSASMNINCGEDFRHSLIASYIGYQNQFLGGTVACSGDINRDEFDDVITGSGDNSPFRYSGNRGMQNNAFVYLGGHQMNLTADYAMAFSNISPNDYPVTYAGDVNHDGYNDIIVGSPYDGSCAYIYFGGPKINITPDITLRCPTIASFFGEPVAGVGDVNGDGIDDIIIGGDDGLNLYFGGPKMNLTPDVVLPQGGASVAGIGDFNKDGFNDIIAGSPWMDTNIGVGTGTASIYFGGKFINFTPDIKLYGESAGEKFGWSVYSAGDFNHDGYLDVIIGAPENSVNSEAAGAAYIYFGGPAMNNSLQLLGAGTSSYDLYGISVSQAGDINKDGFDDVLVGASGDNGGGCYGYANLIFGGPNITASKEITLEERTKFHFDEYGLSVSGNGDVNADSYPDIIVGAPCNDERDGRFDGKIYIYNGSGIASVILDPELKIGDQSIWNQSGVVIGNYSTQDFSDALDSYIASAPISMIDAYGNSFVDIVVNASVLNGKNIDLNTLNITYEYNATVPDFSNVLNLYIANHKDKADINGNLNVSIQLKSQTEGEITLSSLNIVVDEPPILFKPIPNASIDEGTSNLTLIDLQQFFIDDYDTAQNLTYSIINIKNFNVVNVTINSNRFISVDALNDSASDKWSGELNVVVRATDRNGLIRDSNEFNIMVINANDPPIITSTPNLSGVSGTIYSYNITAKDRDNDSLFINLIQKPDNMSIDSTSGHIDWIPPVGGIYNISISVSDGYETTYQNFSINITQPNRPPVFTSSPIINAVVGKKYQYDAQASDPDINKLNYSLVSAPKGMIIDPLHGNITWTPTSNDIGIKSIIIQVNDGKGGIAGQQFNITVIENLNNHKLTLATPDFLLILILIIVIVLILILFKQKGSSKAV